MVLSLSPLKKKKTKIRSYCFQCLFLYIILCVAAERLPPYLWGFILSEKQAVIVHDVLQVFIGLKPDK